MSAAPVVTVLDDDGFRVRYRIEGGEVAPNWVDAQRTDKTPWCEFSIWSKDPSGRSLSSYGGEVWPMAWPDYFRKPILPPDAIDRHPSHVELTDAGLELVQIARVAAGTKARGGA